MDVLKLVREFDYTRLRGTSLTYRFECSKETAMKILDVYDDNYRSGYLYLDELRVDFVMVSINSNPTHKGMWVVDLYLPELLSKLMDEGVEGGLQ